MMSRSRLELNKLGKNIKNLRAIQPGGLYPPTRLDKTLPNLTVILIRILFAHSSPISAKISLKIRASICRKTNQYSKIRNILGLKEFKTGNFQGQIPYNSWKSTHRAINRKPFEFRNLEQKIMFYCNKYNSTY